MSFVIFLVLLVILGLVGRVRLVKQLERLVERNDLAVEFLNKLSVFAESRGQDMETYTWLVRHSTRLQLESGSFGIMAIYRPPYERIAYPNHQIFVNFISDFHHWLTASYPGKTAYQLFMIMHDAIQRYLAYLDNRRETLLKRVNNPLECVVEGVVYALSTPFLILAWIGLISSETVARIGRSEALQIIGKLLFLLGVVGTIVGLVVDWEEFIAIVRRLLR